MSELAIETNQLRKEFGRKVAVAGLTLQVQRGEVFGFLGPNGAGKTTSIKMLLGLTERTSGSATLLNMPLGHRPTRERIGYLPEHFRFYHWLRADEFLHLQGRLYGIDTPTRNRIVPQLLERVGLGANVDTKLAAFSKGMTQRIGLAQALMNEPELVFLDEPTSGLDPMGRRLVRDIIGELRDQGTAVFVNSHLLSEIEKTCDRVAFIQNGTVVETFALAELEQGAIEVRLRVGTVSAELRHYLQSIATQLQTINATTLQFKLQDEQCLPEIAGWLANHSVPLYEMTPERRSLEDRFIEMMGEITPSRPVASTEATTA